MARGRCRLSGDLATAIGAAAGDLVELLPAKGPARRLWVDEVSGASEAGAAWIGEDATGETFAVRRLDGAIAR